MQLGGLTYIEGDTPVHRCDARVKIIALLAFSIVLMCVTSWPALAACTVAVIAVAALARIPFGLMNRMLVPIYVMAAFAFIFNIAARPDAGGALAGAFLAVRMIVLVAASFAVCLTASSSELLDAFAWYLEPLRRLHVPVDDIAFTLALSIRFIPVIEREFRQIRFAQISRGGDAPKSFVRALKVWGSAFSALFIGLFRHAGELSTAMDARCYGASEKRTRLSR